MKPAAPAESLEVFQTKAFARHMLFDFPFPMTGTVLVLGLMGWVLHGRVANALIAAWISVAVSAGMVPSVTGRGRMRLGA